MTGFAGKPGRPQGSKNELGFFLPGHSDSVAFGTFLNLMKYYDIDKDILNRMVRQGTVFTTEAVDLALRGEVKPPPKLDELLAVRFRSA